MNSSEPFSQFCFQFLDCHFLPAIAYVFSIFSSFICQQFSPHHFTVLFSSTPSLFLRSSFFFLFIFLDSVFEYSSIHYGTTVVVLISEGSSDKWEVNWYLVIRSPRGVITKRWLAEGEKEPHPKLQYAVTPAVPNFVRSCSKKPTLQAKKRQRFTQVDRIAGPFPIVSIRF